MGENISLKVKVKISVSSDHEETLKYPYVQIQIEIGNRTRTRKSTSEIAMLSENVASKEFSASAIPITSSIRISLVDIFGFT